MEENMFVTRETFYYSQTSYFNFDGECGASN